MTEKNINYPAAYVVNGESSSLSVIRLSDNTLSDSIMLMGTGTNMIMWPHHISSYSNYLAIGVPGAQHRWAERRRIEDRNHNQAEH